MTQHEIRAGDLVAYLTRTGWMRSAAARVAQIWTHSQRPGHELLVPVIEAAPDFDHRVRILTEDLARVEARPSEQIAEDLARQFLDVTDLCADYPSADEGIPLGVGFEMFQAARHLVVAGAGATIRRSGHFGRSMPRRAYEHAAQVLLGHTRRGSYVVPIISRARVLDQPWQGDQPRLVEAVEDAAFDRRAAVTLANALEALQQLVLERDQPPPLGEINQGVLEGVSFELCDAIDQVIHRHEIPELAVNFRWAPAVNLPGRAPIRVHFPASVSPLVRHVADTLKTKPLKGETVIYGVVTRLSSKPGDEGGRVDVEAIVDGRKRTVQLDLNGGDYEVARHCHKHSPVQIRGLLHIEPGRKARMSASSFQQDLSIPVLAARSEARVVTT